MLWRPPAGKARKERQSSAILPRASFTMLWRRPLRAMAISRWIFLSSMASQSPGHFGFNLRGRYFLAKAGYDEAFRRHGPGQLLVNEILSQTRERGLREFDFVGPATWDESRWASARRTNYRVFIFRKSLYGALLYAAANFRAGHRTQAVGPAGR